MKTKQFTTSGEVQKNIIVPNPGNRCIVIPGEKSGYTFTPRKFKEQIFESNIFSKEISGVLIGLTEAISGYWHPTYLLEPSTNNLFLEGKEGYINGIDILNEICEKLISQTGIYAVRSIRKSDLDLFHYELEEDSKYWLASTEIRTNSSGVKYVSEGKIMYSELQYHRDNNRKNKRGAILNKVRPNNAEYRDIDSYPIRPVVILNTVITNY